MSPSAASAAVAAAAAATETTPGVGIYTTQTSSELILKLISCYINTSNTSYVKKYESIIYRLHYYSN